MFYLLFVAFAVLLAVYAWLTGRPRNFPPGPPCLPLVGSAPYLTGANPQFLMEQWRTEYGPVVGLMFGPSPAVAVVDARAVLEVLRHEDFQGRPQLSVNRDRTFGESLGVFFSDGAYWAEQRRFTLRHLKEFGFGKKSMEGLILEEAEGLVQELKHGSPRILQVNKLFTVSVINVLWSVMSGVRHRRDDPDFRRLLDELERQFREGDPTGGGGFVNLVPALRSLSSKWRRTLRGIGQLQDFVRDAIREHERTFDDGFMRDFLDVYLKEMQRGAPGSGFHEKSLITICLDLFGAGAESVSHTLGFCLLYLLHHPHVQTRIHQELDHVVGRGRRVALDDRHGLVYLEATLLEVMRINTIAPLAVPHRVTRDTKLHGYDIPKDTMVLLSLWSCGHDAAHWGDPDNFRPERHIDVDGRLLKNEYLVTFGAGKRVCLGEALARNSLYLIFATMMQELTFTSPPGQELPDTVPMPGFTVAPQPFSVLVTQRA